MIIPSIDLMDGQAVQLVQGKTKVLEAGDPRPIATRFGRTGEIAVVDLDAALGRGDNTAVISELLRLAPCRVGGGIRDVAAAQRWLDAGATRVVLGTAARPEVLRELPRERVIAALDARDGEVVVEGWRKATGARIADRMRELAPFVAGFLVTFVEREGTLTGTNMDLARELKANAGDRELTIAGGVQRVEEIAELDRMGMDAQIGMALYTGRFSVADALIATLRSDRPDGLWPTVVVEGSGETLGLVYSNTKSLRTALEEGRGVYWSRSRNALWRKGDTSGDAQELLRVELDCDRDALKFTVRQSGGFCHTGSRSCFGSHLWQDVGVHALVRRLQSTAAAGGPAGSYTARLLQDPTLLHAKIREEADELSLASARPDIVHEAADVLYFTLVKLAAAGISFTDIERELDRRALRVTRRAGDAKIHPARTEPRSTPDA